jgi:hypothetical protein
MRSNIKPIVNWSVVAATCSNLVYWISQPPDFGLATSRLPELCFVLVIWIPFTAIAILKPVARFVARDPHRVSEVAAEALLVTVLTSGCLMLLLLAILYKQ